jgi:hypothetical protein
MADEISKTSWTNGVAYITNVAGRSHLYVAPRVNFTVACIEFSKVA